MQPISPRGLNLSHPLSAEKRARFRNPGDRVQY
ncbi:hypothetical protein DM82_5141 [Burkholderia oklahomensis]|uniref:Uncharacterized protein n=1 Tax=Burkholderia oklahomensis TaxID=342113 RepID=A0AAI8BBT0_9BURK|nr:hypothetical protein DM82_5141 [Burkholderia oklahomensis]AJX34484.1 hypothetical protein BG90_5453 [Burkholderia oklahomensis C6786]SUY26778.1 Uncharacterised protein [Burkholderia oklahomensis]